MKWIKNHSFGIIITILILLSVLFVFLTIKTDRVATLIGSEFLISFRASLLEDLIFFSLIGLVLYFVTFRSIDDEEVDRRIESLISAKNVTEDAQNHFKENFKSLLTYYKTLRVDVIVTDVNSDKYIKIESSFNGDIYNFSKDMNVETKVRAYAFSDSKEHDSSGQITLLEILDSKGNKLENGAITMIPVDKEKGFVKNMYVSVGLNTYIRFRFKFWIWNFLSLDKPLDNSGFKISTDRFVDKLEIYIKTTTKDIFDIHISKEVENEIGEDKKWGNVKKIKGLSESSAKHYSIDNFTKNELISLNFIKRNTND